MRTAIALVLTCTAGLAHAQPAPPPPPSTYPGPYAPPPAPYPAPYAYGAPPAPMPAPTGKGDWFGYQEIIVVGAFAALGAWASNADLNRDDRTGAVTACLTLGMAAGPGLHLINGNTSQAKLRLSAQLIAGGALVGFLGSLLIEASNKKTSADGQVESEIDWGLVGTATFVGMGIGAGVDGIAFGYKAPRLTDYRTSFLVAPTRTGGMTVGLGGAF